MCLYVLFLNHIFLIGAKSVLKLTSVGDLCMISDNLLQVAWNSETVVGSFFWRIIEQHAVVAESLRRRLSQSHLSEPLLPSNSVVPSIYSEPLKFCPFSFCISL